ncbi:hypothetical protein PINS_up014031 [Pythium insidiosum]|nr:hypothetical protein PINS_up014031 [Pythium insidiosum]
MASPSSRTSDVLFVQVNIYGSRELFVNEYRLMLADKLLQNLTYDTDRDVQTLELLKLRFGEESLLQSEIMVRDIDDSKRVNQNVRSSLQTPFVVDATIVSQHFWPPLQSEDFVLHPRVAEHVEQYKRAYAVLKNPRTLVWNNALGSVEVCVLDFLYQTQKRTNADAVRWHSSMWSLMASSAASRRRRCRRQSYSTLTVEVRVSISILQREKEKVDR